MRVLLTGSRGFIGKHLTKSLVSTGAVVVPITLHENQKNILTLDQLLASPKSYISSNDVLVHLAAAGRQERNSNDTHSVNFIKSSKLLDIAQRYNVRKIIAAGSGMEYGRSFKYLGPVADTSPINPLDGYSMSKARLADYLSEKIKLPFSYIRFFQIYGFGSELPKLDAEIRASIESGILKLKNPFFQRDFINICDVVKLLSDEIYRSPGLGIVNFCTGEGTTIREFCEKILSAVPQESRPKMVDFESHGMLELIESYVGVPSKMFFEERKAKKISEFTNIELLESLYKCRC
jgi:nucleoside-diphosphate-sugar epimerase